MHVQLRTDETAARPVYVLREMGTFQSGIMQYKSSAMPMPILMIEDHYWDLSNEVLQDNLSQGESELPEVKDLDMCKLLYKRGFFLELLNLTSGSFDAPCDKASYSTSFERSQ